MRSCVTSATHHRYVVPSVAAQTLTQPLSPLITFYGLSCQRPNDRDHRVRLALGNGIRADVWREFISRFGKIQIHEFYGATEGNIALHNYTGRIGAVGRDSFLNRVTAQVCFLHCGVKCVHQHAGGFCLADAFPLVCDQIQRGKRRTGAGFIWVLHKGCERWVSTINNMVTIYILQVTLSWLLKGHYLHIKLSVL